MSEDLVEALHAQIDAGGDPRISQVLADALLERGDPRGELILLQHAMETSGGAENMQQGKRAKEILSVHAHTLLGFVPGPEIALSWTRGFVEEAHIKQEAYAKEVRLLDALSALLTHPGGRHLRRLVIDGAPQMPGPDGLQSLLSAVREAGISARPSLSSVRLGGWYAQHGNHWFTHDFERSSPELSDLWAIFPGLEALEIDLGAVDFPFAAIHAEHLRSFIWVNPHFIRNDISRLSAARWPNLEELRLWTGGYIVVNQEEDIEDGAGYTEDPVGDGVLSPDHLEPLFAHLDSLPKIDTVGIINYWSSVGSLLAEASRHPFLKRIKTLDLSGGQLAPRDVPAFVKRCQALPRLEQLIVDDLRISDVGFMKLTRALSGLHVEGTNSSSSIPGYLYVSVME